MSSVKAESRRVARFGVAGVVNTAVGFAVIFCLTALAVAPHIANAIGYAVGLGLSFALSKYFVFRSRAKTRSALGLFVGCFVFAFILNQTVLYVGIHEFAMRPLWAQAGAVGVYCVSMYMLQRYLVFPETESMDG